MKRIWISSFVTIWFLSLILPVPRIAQPQEEGLIKGKVLNRTTGGKGVAGVEVTLHQIVNEQEDQKERTKTNKDGTVSFPGLSRGRGLAYYLSTRYEEVEYFSPTVSFGDKKELLLHLSVYETTDKDTTVFVKMHHVLIGLEEGELWVQEIIVLENAGDRVYVGSREVEPGKKEVLRISLPKNATALEFSKSLMACCTLKTEDGFIDTMDIKPGRKEISFAYKVDYGPSRYELSKMLYAKTESIDFFIPDKGITAKSDMLEFKGWVGNPDQRFLHLSGKDLTKGSKIVLELRGLPWGKGFFRFAMVGLVVVIMGAGLAYPFMRRRVRRAESRKPEIMKREKVSLLDQRKELIWEIAHLDKLFESDKIGPEEYRSKRKHMMERAKEITRQLRGLAKYD